MSTKKPVAVVVGVGPGIGGALAKRFSADGYAVALLARSRKTSDALARELPDSRAIECDAGDPDSIAKAFVEVREELGEVEVLLYNAGSGVWGSAEDISLEAFENAWRVNALGALAATKEVVGPMKKKGQGSIVFIGATASRRGNKMTAAFAPAKAAQRSLAESMARSLWPAGIHVSLIIVDGVVDLPTTRARMEGKPDSFFIQPDGVAATALSLVKQERSSWSFEVEARPFGESW